MCAPLRKGSEFGRLISRHLRARGHVLCDSLEALTPATAWSRLSGQVTLVGNVCPLPPPPPSPGYLEDQVRSAPAAGLDMLDTWTHP